MSANDSENPTVTDLIVTEFAFLVDCGFRPTVESASSVRYDDDRGVFVGIPRFQRQVRRLPCCPTEPTEGRATATELARLSGVDAPRSEFPADADQLQVSVANFAMQLRSSGERALSGDESIFDEALELGREHTRSFTRRVAE